MFRGKDGRSGTGWSLRAAQEILQASCRCCRAVAPLPLLLLLLRAPPPPREAAAMLPFLGRLPLPFFLCACPLHAAVQESFDPIMDLGSNTDLLPVMLYARRAGEWDYSNCLTLLLRHKVSGVIGHGWDVAIACTGLCPTACLALASAPAALPIHNSSPSCSPLLLLPLPPPCRASRWWRPSAACLAHRWRSCR